MIFIKIAYLILAHTDPEHVARLATRISVPNKADVYIHVDKKTDIEPFKKLVKGSITFIEDRITVNWGGYNSVLATLSLLKTAYKSANYDRFILLQGLDYPIASNNKIFNFFEENNDVEFIRACKITGSKDTYHTDRCQYYWFYDDKNLIKKMINKANSLLPIKLRKGYVHDDKIYNVYWGSALWALTNNCVEYILNFSGSHEKFNNYFKHVFPPDETYFHSIVYNSPFGLKTHYGGEEPERHGLVNWKNIHYFEYPDNIKIFTEIDYEQLTKLDFLFFRKATTEKSIKLLDMIDGIPNEIEKIMSN